MEYKKLDIIKIPFSYYRSYMAFIQYDANKSDAGAISGVKENGLYMKSVHGKSKGHSVVCRIVPMLDGKEVDFTVVFYPYELSLIGEGWELKIAYIDEDSICFEGKGKGLHLKLDTLPVSVYDYAYCLQGETDYIVMNSYKSLTKYVCYTQVGEAKLYQELNESNVGSLTSCIQVQGDHFRFVLQEVQTHLAACKFEKRTYETIQKLAQKEFESFLTAFPKVKEEYAMSYQEAIYILWSATVKKAGLLKRDAIWMSKTNFLGVWSWDHAFNALGLAGVHNELAFDQMLLPFDVQDDQGQLPGSVSDSTIRWNFSKPPVQGLLALAMLKHMDFSDEQWLLLYEKIEKQISFWFTYKDSDQDGICEYHHGNDSGQDNSTAFRDSFVVDAPDLSAYLVKAMEFEYLAAKRLNKETEAQDWQAKKIALENKMVRYFIVDNEVVVKDTHTKARISTDSIIKYEALLVWDILPSKVKDHLLETLKSENYTTAFGLATEATTSPLFDPIGYWRGPIWAPTMILFIDALEAMGETAFAKSLALKFCDTVNQYGCYENFDPLSGKGLCDTAHTWTSSSYIYLLRKYGSV